MVIDTDKVLEAKAELEAVVAISVSKAMTDFTTVTGLTLSSIDIRMTPVSQINRLPERWYVLSGVKAEVHTGL